MKRYRDAFYSPVVADLNNHGGWVESGGKDSTQRATDIWKKVLKDFQAPAHGAEAAQRIAPYIEAAQARGGTAPTGA